MKIIHKALNTLRKFKKEYEIKEYFTFPNVDHQGKQSTYTMTDKQMTEWEDAQVRKSTNRVIHQMRATHKTIEGVRYGKNEKNITVLRKRRS
mgnify:FL=1